MDAARGERGQPTGGMSRLGIGVIGVGKVGAVLASAWRACGHSVVAAAAHSPASRERAEVMLPGVPLVPVEEVVRRSELVLLAVPDDTLPGLVAGLADLGHFSSGQLVLHPAGRFGAAVLAPAVARGALGIALHPAMTFTGTSLDIARLAGCPVAVTCAPALTPIGQALAVELGAEPFVVAEEDRPLYHAALVHGANHLVTLVSQAVRVAAQAGVPAESLRPLLTAALDRALREGEEGLTGPVVRGDVGTIREHLVALKQAAQRETREGPSGQSLGEALRTYRDLAGATVRRARQLGTLHPPVADEIAEALEA
ncbi:Rossmann-like and DUF2520 domain-containing protein [Buchananella hordeovulneris]|uniref:Oxidoreductase n=2 Tax=Buchananella hordeovulneris TaxID=52770 RepID=A0A1Q5PVF2_9ACTO|nr:Rossmann-like and DUF2520 domain-containing protein [Buchananella hordeovulneris]OKL51439.1 oxidoreductase [Buchananella hordeovulneris]RRD44298.1 DUF2520 domain-containing protein [Buchananella hordeovulneris]